MSAEPKSRFVAKLDDSASEENRRPNLKGDFAVVDGPQATISLWRKVAKATGTKYLKGTIEAKSALAALTADAPAETAEPAGIKLKVGQAIAFFAKADAPAGSPAVYGFARTSAGYVKLAGWDRGNGLITGSAEPYRPRANDPEVPAGESFDP